MMAIGISKPHLTWYVPQKYFDLFPLDEVAVPKLKKGDLDDVPPLGVKVTEGKSRFVEAVLGAGTHDRHDLTLDCHHLRGVGLIAVLSDGRAGQAKKQDHRPIAP